MRNLTKALFFLVLSAFLLPACQAPDQRVSTGKSWKVTVAVEVWSETYAGYKVFGIPQYTYHWSTDRYESSVGTEMFTYPSVCNGAVDNPKVDPQEGDTYCRYYETEYFIDFADGQAEVGVDAYNSAVTGTKYQTVKYGDRIEIVK